MKVKLYDPMEDVPAFDQIDKARRDEVLKVLLAQYVERHGLGGMSKGDLDALIIHLFLKCSKKRFNAFDLSVIFKIKESRIKSLIETAAVKFEEDAEELIWMRIVEDWASSITEIESIEKGQVVFKFEHPGHFRFIQNEVRIAGGTVSYSRSSEAMTISLATLFKVLDQAHGHVLKDKKGFQYLIENLLKKIKNDLIGQNELEKIKKDKEKKLKLTQIISTASNLVSIGKVVSTVFGVPAV